MNSISYELLLRYLDGALNGEERQLVEDCLRNDATVRAMLAGIAEQAVRIADVERTTMARESVCVTEPAKYPGAGNSRSKVLATLSAAVLLMALTALTALAFFPAKRSVVARVSKVSGATQFFGANGVSEAALEVSAELGGGDTLEARSCDSLVELEVDGRSTLLMAGKSSLRVLSPLGRRQRFEMPYGTLWVHRDAGSDEHIVVLPTASVQFGVAALNVQTSASESIVRVNSGRVHVTTLIDGRTIEVPSGHQVYVTLSGKVEPRVVQQPQPTDTWRCELQNGLAVLLGSWLPPTGQQPSRLGAAPLLWPVPNRDPIMLYAVAIAAWRSSPQPVQLQADSRLIFRGRVEQPRAVRFGFSTQKRHGVFAGKFEVDVAAEDLGPAGQSWKVELPLSRFQALHPQLASSVDGLELTDVYALTIQRDVSLEIHHIEVLPNRETRPANEDETTPGNLNQRTN